eukprot:5358762-Alexandrium_andersonii.AAC.1
MTVPAAACSGVEQTAAALPATSSHAAHANASAAHAIAVAAAPGHPAAAAGHDCVWSFAAAEPIATAVVAA